MAVMAPWAERYLRIAAALQEMFDAEVLDLPWNNVAVGNRISDDEVSRLSRSFRGSEDRLRGYCLVVDAAAPYDVLFCLEQNLAWGSRIRLRFAREVQDTLYQMRRLQPRLPTWYFRRYHDQDKGGFQIGMQELLRPGPA